MSFFNDILYKRGLDKCPLPLWKLKLTDDEYEELRAILVIRTHSVEPADVFINLQRECALFYAEYWRREYKVGSHSKALVYSALRSSVYSRELASMFYDAASKGAKKLGIEIYEGKHIETFDSLLYQGGLPMNLLTAGGAYSTWERFTRGLVNRHINFEELNLGVIATESSSLRQYCDQLVYAIEADQYLLLPFYCEDENNYWFVYLKNLAKQERHRKRQLRPFSLDWEFTLDHNTDKLIVKYILKGTQSLPNAFLEDQNLLGKKFFTTQVRVNGKVVKSFDYSNNYSRYAVVSKHVYNEGENIAFYINESEQPHLSDELDMNVPHLVYRNDKGTYTLGNRLGKTDCAVIIPKDWTLVNDELEKDLYDWQDGKYQIAFVPENYIMPITLNGKNGKIEFSSSVKLIWTEYNGCPVGIDGVSELLYDANNLQYSICYDDDDDVKRIVTNNVEYRGVYQSIWQNTAPFGNILIRANDSRGRFVTPVRMINIGSKEDLIIDKVLESDDTCCIRVIWKYGKVVCEKGAKRINNQWIIKKEECDNNKIRFILIPDGDNLNQFKITVRAPFKGFAILNYEDKPVTRNSWVPYDDIDKYHYHLVGQSIKKYTYGNKQRELKVDSGELHIYENGKRLKRIPFEGSLTALFDSREVLRAMLDKTSENLLNAELEISFLTSNGKALNFAIKDSPYRVKQVGDNIYITSRERQQIDYRGTLNLIKLDEPELEPRELCYDEENGYVVPEEIKKWGKIIVTGKSRGRICPCLIDMTQDLSGELRKSIRLEAINHIKEEIEKATIGDEFWNRVLTWYRRVQEDGIPASALLELKCIADNPIALLCLAFQLFAQCVDDEKKISLKNQLKSFSSDLSFQWYWLRTYVQNLMAYLKKKVDSFDNSVIRSIYVQWAMKQKNPMLYLVGMDNNIYLGQCILENMTIFQKWMQELEKESLLEQYEDNDDELTITVANDIIFCNSLFHIDVREPLYIEEKQDHSFKTAPFFNRFAEKKLVSENEQWMYKRVNAIAAHLKGDIDLFNENGHIRRSIIFCSKSCNKRFVIELNNKLTKQ